MDQVLQQRLKALKSLQMHHPSPGESGKDAAEDRPVGHDVKSTTVEVEDTGHEENDMDVRAEFVIKSVDLLVKLEETLMSLVRYKGMRCSLCLTICLISAYSSLIHDDFRSL